MVGVVTEYGAAGRVGVLTPSGNPTVEPEFSVLLGSDVAMFAMRMTSASPDMNGRLVDYGQTLERWMAAFGDLSLDAIAFACTGTSYLAEETLPRSWTGPGGTTIPFLSAACAIEEGLRALGCRRISLVSPYSDELTETACAYWTKRGFTISAVTKPVKPEAGHPIYLLTTGTLRGAIEKAQATPSDAVVALGTGAPTLGAIAFSPGPARVLSSNLCLAWSVERALKGETAGSISAWISPDAAWRKRLAARFPSLDKSSN